MLYAAYLYEQANRYRELAQQELSRQEAARKAAAEYDELAAVCERVAEEVEDHASAG
jgi:hypothetical protein